MEYLASQGADEVKDTYVSLKKAFDRLIVNTHKPKYCQYLLFFFCNRHADFVNDFLNHLFLTLENESASNLQKINCVLYIGSFVARAKYVQDVTIQRVLFLFIEWMLNYISVRENENPNPESHKLFYHIFQSTCYIVINTHEKIFENVENTILKDLKFDIIAYSSLNPLKICYAPLMKKFVNIASNYGIKLFDILEMNENITLPTGYTFSESYFPFDPFFTKQSSKYILDLYNMNNDNKVDSGYQTEEETGNESEMDQEFYEIDGSYASSTMMQMLGSSFPSSGILLGSSVQSSGGTAFDEEALQNKSPFKLY